MMPLYTSHLTWMGKVIRVSLPILEVFFDLISIHLCIYLHTSLDLGPIVLVYP
jgi:hypothetical protein